MAIRKENGYQRKERGNSKRKQKRIILIAAEGRNKTETNYFKKWNNSEYRIAFVKNEYTDPVNMMNNDLLDPNRVVSIFVLKPEVILNGR